MKSTFIFMTFEFLVSTVVLAYLCSQFLEKTFKKLSKSERLHLLTSFTFVISTVIYMFTVTSSLLFSFLVITLFFCIFLTSLTIINAYLREAFLIVFELSASIAIFIICMLAPLKDSAPEKISEEEIVLDKYIESSENAIVIEIIEDKQKVYSIMGYENNKNLPFILYDADISNYEISNKQEEKIVINNFEIKSYSILACFGFTKPKVNRYSEYSIYLNKDDLIKN